MGRLDGKVALVTGAARGTGAVIARLFVEEGAARVIVADVRDDLGEAHVASLGPTARYLHLDVTSEQEWARVVDAVMSAEQSLQAAVAIRDNRVEVTLRIDPGTGIRTDSVASIQFTGLMGQNFVSLTFGSEKAPRASAGALLQSREQADLAGPAGEVADAVEQLLEAAEREVEGL